MSSTPASPQPSDVETASTMLLTVSSAIMAVAASSLAAVDDSLTLAQFRTLHVAATAGPMTAGQLAEQLGIHQSTVTRRCERLVKKQLLTKTVSPANRREVTIQVTATGRQLVEQVVAKRQQELRRMVSEIPDALRGSMVAAMQVFADAAGETPRWTWE